MSPQRIQRRRTKGWRMPEGAVYVGRPTRWGNPWAVVRAEDAPGWMLRLNGRLICASSDRDELLVAAVKQHREWIERLVRYQVDRLDELAGKDLACWCRLDQPCHADILLHLANRGDR